MFCWDFQLFDDRKLYWKLDLFDFKKYYYVISKIEILISRNLVFSFVNSLCKASIWEERNFLGILSINAEMYHDLN